MTNLNAQVISYESIQRIRTSLKVGDLTATEVYCNINELFEVVSSNRNLEKIELVDPLSAKPTQIQLVAGDESTDKQNAKIVFDTFTELTPVQATDIRLWATVSLELFDDYTKIRWSFPSNSTGDQSKLAARQINFVSNRIYDNTGRSIRRNNAISRLWWLGFVANSSEDLNFDDALNALLTDQDVATSFLDRATITQVPNVSNALLNLMHEEYSIRNLYDRDKHRNFLKLLDLYAGSHAYAIMSKNEIEVLVRKAFDFSYA